MAEVADFRVHGRLLFSPNLRVRASHGTTFGNRQVAPGGIDLLMYYVFVAVQYVSRRRLDKWW